MQDLAPKTKVLGVDYGRKNIGFALSDETGTVAAPLPSARVGKGNRPAKVIIKQISASAANHVVYGLPRGLGAKPTKMSQEVKHVATAIHKQTGVPYSFWDETYTSQQASKSLSPSKKALNHSKAAQIILQEYLNYQASHI